MLTFNLLMTCVTIHYTTIVQLCIRQMCDWNVCVCVCVFLYFKDIRNESTRIYIYIYYIWRVLVVIEGTCWTFSTIKRQKNDSQVASEAIGLLWTTSGQWSGLCGVKVKEGHKCKTRNTYTH